MQFEIKEAVREGQWAKIAIKGPSGGGKSFTALQLAKGLTRNGKILVVDSERGSIKKYAKALGDMKFSVMDPPNFAPDWYAMAVKHAVAQGFDTIIIDSLSHTWMGKGGALEMVDKAAKRSSSGNSFTAWRDVNPVLAEFTDVLLSVPAHVIATVRVKQGYVMQENSKGKIEPKKVGIEPIIRDGFEYEFDIVGNMDMDNNLIIEKTRVEFINGEVYHKPTWELGRALRDWYDGNEPELTAPEAYKVVEVSEDPVIPPPPVAEIEGPTTLQRIGGLMKRKNVSLDDVVREFGDNPRQLSEEVQDQLISWLEAK